MDLLVIRHAVAEDREAFARTGGDDGERPLTTEGRRKMREAVRGLRTLVDRVDLLAFSPLVRAAQTAKIVAGAYQKLPTVEIAELEPEQGPEPFAEWLAQRAEATVAAVGHEPMLGLMVSFLLTGRASSLLELKKGGACLVTFSARVAPGNGTLRWALPPRQLRALGAKR